MKSYIVRKVECKDIQLGMTFLDGNGNVSTINAKEVKDSVFVMNLLGDQWRDKLEHGIWAIDYDAMRENKDWWKA